MKKILCLLLWLLPCLNAFSQNLTPQDQKYIDSLKHVIAATSSDSGRVVAMNQVAGKFVASMDFEAVRYAEKALHLAEKIQLHSEIVKSYWWLSKFYAEQGNFSLTMHYSTKELKISEMNNNYDYTSRFLIQIAIRYYYQKNYQKGLVTVLKALPLKDKLENKDLEVRMLCLIGVGYAYLNDYKKANHYAELALPMIGQLQEGMKVIIFHDMGMIFHEQKRYSEALHYYRQALALGEKLNLIPAMTRYQISIAETFEEQENYAEALKFCKDAMRTASSLSVLKVRIYHMISRMHARNNQFAQAYQYSNKAYELRDSVLTEESQKAVAEMGALYELGKKDAQIDVLTKNEQLREEKLHNSNLMLYGSSALLAVLLLFGFSLFSSNRYKQKVNEILKEQSREIETKNKVLFQQKEEIESQLEEIESQSQQLKRVLEKMEVQNHILQESETELLQLNAVKTKYFSLLSHDMRNSFGSLRMYLPLLEDRLKPHLDPQTGQLFANFKTSVKNINALLDNLLLWSVSQMNMMPMEQKPVALAALAEENFELFRPVADEKKIALINHIQPGVFVSADVNMLNTILRDLVSNALKFTTEGGIIEVSAQSQGDQVEITVQDSGIGISVVDQLKLFNINTNHKTAQAAKGTGLGLILCKEFTEKMGGRIRVESEPGKGTAFVFWLSVGSNLSNYLKSMILLLHYDQSPKKRYYCFSV